MSVPQYKNPQYQDLEDYIYQKACEVFDTDSPTDDQFNLVADQLEQQEGDRANQEEV